MAYREGEASGRARRRAEVLGDGAWTEYRVERAGTGADLGAFAFGDGAGRAVTLAFCRLATPAMRAAAMARAKLLTIAVHPRAPRLRSAFVTQPRGRSSDHAVFVCEVAPSVDLEEVSRRLVASSVDTKLALILEVARQLFELGCAAEIAGLSLTYEDEDEPARLAVSSAGLFVRPSLGGSSAGEATGYPAAFAVRNVARCAVRLRERLVGDAPLGRFARPFERLEGLARESSRTPPSRDLLSWIHPLVSRYDRQRFRELCASVVGQTTSDTPTAVQAHRGRRDSGKASLAPLAVHVAAAAARQTRPIGRPRPEAPRGRRRALLGVVLSAAAVCGVAALVMIGVHSRAPRSAVKARLPAQERPLLRLPARYASATRKTPPPPPCVDCVDLSAAPSGFRVFLDGRVVGETPLVVSIPCGTHQLRVGSRSRPRTVAVRCAPSP